MSIFDFNSYLDIIKRDVAANATVRGYQKRLAEGAGCQSSYFSQVVKGSASLTPDQAVSLCEHWRFNDLETEFFLALLNRERAGTERLRQRISIQIERLRSESRRHANLVNPNKEASSKVPAEFAAFYWSNWHCPAIHEILRLPAYRTIHAIAKRFQLTPTLVKKTLESLEEMQLVVRVGHEWQPNSKLVIVDQDETLLKAYHQQMRDRANTQLMAPENVAMTFTCVDTIARTDIPVVAELLRELAKKQMKISDEGASEELVCLCLDFFVV